MRMLMERQYVEIFHLLFLAQLGKKVDKRFYTLKGGCNLRFFFGSPRYSEGMDIDVAGIPVFKLKDSVSSILKSKPFSQILQVRGIRVEHINDDKQTETTQRWKLGLDVPQVDRPIPTKVEFSRRGMSDERAFAAVDALLSAEYGMASIMTNHYLTGAAFQQKVKALADRRETQARDIFDLDILLSAGADPATSMDRCRRKAGTARDKALQIDFSAFKSQVVAYLPPEEQAFYDEDVWDAMLLRVCEALEQVAL